MKEVPNILVGLALIAALFSLGLLIFDGVTDIYGISETNLKNDKNIMQSLDELLIVQSINETYTAVTKITSPSGNFDLLGGLLGAGIGAVKTILGIATLPGDIFGVIVNYYGVDTIPAPVYHFLGLAFSIYLAFILYRLYVRAV